MFQEGDEILVADFQPARPVFQGFLLQHVVGPNGAAGEPQDRGQVYLMTVLSAPTVG